MRVGEATARIGGLPRGGRGFTLIEVMVTLAIVGILAAIAIPVYAQYVVRARWADVVSRIGPVKLALSDCIHANADNPTVCASSSALTDGSTGQVWLQALPSLAPYDAALTVEAGPSIRIRANGETLRRCVVRFDVTLTGGSLHFTPHTEVGCTRADTGLPS